MNKNFRDIIDHFEFFSFATEAEAKRAYQKAQSANNKIQSLLKVKEESGLASFATNSATSSEEKPNLTYLQLVSEAFTNSDKVWLTKQDIVESISKKYAYYRLDNLRNLKKSIQSILANNKSFFNINISDCIRYSLNIALDSLDIETDSNINAQKNETFTLKSKVSFLEKDLRTKKELISNYDETIKLLKHEIELKENEFKRLNAEVEIIKDYLLNLKSNE